MILYGSTMSPFVRKVAAFAVEKGIALDMQPTRMNDPDPGFRAASPFRKMPALVDGDYAVADSSAIIHYLEALHPEPALIPADPKERGKVIWFDEFADTIVSACNAKMFFNRIVAPRFMGRDGDEAIAAAAERDELPPILDYLEGALPDDGHLVGGRLTLADIAVASPLANLRHLDIAIDPARWPKVAAFEKQMLARPSFATFIEREAKALAQPN